LRDALEMEWIGIPAVSIAHEALAGSVEAMKSICKMPTYPYIQIRYPHSSVGKWDDRELEQIVDELVPQVIDLLTDQRFAEKYAAQDKPANERTAAR
jgi:hypothetical protein